MASAFQVGAVVYAKNLALVHAFYRSVLGLEVAQADDDYVVLASPTFQLVVLRMPEPIAASVEIADPPRLRTQTPIKLFFAVASITATRALAPRHGGALLPPEREWDFQGWRVCDGNDPEGNIVQFREYRP